MRITRNLAVLAAAAVLVVVSAAPAYAGASTPGTPPADISTTHWTTLERGGFLHLVCYFTVPATMPAAGEGSLGEYKGAWVAPTRPTVTTSDFDNCLPPGVNAASEEWADGNGASVPTSPTRVVAFRTSLAMYCSWPLSSIP